jgi:hypothetical protein
LKRIDRNIGIASAIFELEKNKMNHRNIKLDSILVKHGDDGQITLKLHNFRYAIQREEINSIMKEHVGTPVYMVLFFFSFQCKLYYWTINNPFVIITGT